MVMTRIKPSPYPVWILAKVAMRGQAVALLLRFNCSAKMQSTSGGIAAKWRASPRHTSGKQVDEEKRGLRQRLSGRMQLDVWDSRPFLRSSIQPRS
jgi:hypothetical protein